MDSLRRYAAVLGLLGLGWIAYGLVSGELALLDAGIRAGALLVGVLLITTFMRVGIGLLASSLERSRPTGP